jgi:hypothetical protein
MRDLCLDEVQMSGSQWQTGSANVWCSVSCAGKTVRAFVHKVRVLGTQLVRLCVYSCVRDDSH